MTSNLNSNQLNYQRTPAISSSNWIPKINLQYQLHETQLVKDRILEKINFDFYTTSSSTSSQVEEQLETNLFFITYQFKKEFVTKRFTKNNQLVLLDSIGNQYSSMVGNFIKQPFSVNEKLLPFLQVYFEDENARNSTAAHDIQVPHFHGLMVLHPKTINRFTEYLNENATEKLVNGRPAFVLKARDYHPLETLTFEKFDGTRSLDYLASYTTKYARNDRFVKGHGEDLELSAIFPKLPKEKYPFYKYAKTPIFTQDEYASFAVPAIADKPKAY